MRPVKQKPHKTEVLRGWKCCFASVSRLNALAFNREEGLSSERKSASRDRAYLGYVTWSTKEDPSRSRSLL